MLARLIKASKEKDQGFTLIELLVVIVIIGILAAIAIPLFLSQREKGVEASMKSDLKTFATNQETYFVDAGTYAGSTAALTDFTATEGNTITVVSASTDAFCAKAESTGTDAEWWYDSDGGGLKDVACT